jgi:hypothetical protein
MPSAVKAEFFITRQGTSPSKSIHIEPSATEHQEAAVTALDPKDISDVLEIVIGMPCMITANTSTTLGVANGSRGSVIGICVHPQDEMLLQSSEVRSCAVACNTSFNMLTALCEIVATTSVRAF